MEICLMPESQSLPLPKPPANLADIAASTPGATLHGNGQVVVSDLAHPRMVTGPDQMVLILDAAALGLISRSPFSVKAAVVAAGIEVPEGLLEGYISVERPRFALATLLSIFDKPLHAFNGIHPTAVIESGVQIHPTVSVGAFCYVGENARIGANTILMPHVTVGAQALLDEGCILHSGVRIGERVMLGKRVIIQHNASIGADGFSYVTPEPGSIESAQASGGKVTGQNTEIIRINSIGTVVLEDDVEIGACATVDRSNLGATLVKKGTKIDNLVMVAHNNVVGENCLIVSQVGIAGSCEIGDRVVIAGQAGLADHLKVGDDAIIMAQSGVMRDVEPKSVVMGAPAMPKREAFQNYMYMNKLKDLFQDMKALKKRVAELEAEKKSPVEV
jgi:UDP-3-O-[3-hydroxymyristoyl] glucosamine N-acyltransferase